MINLHESSVAELGFAIVITGSTVRYATDYGLQHPEFTGPSCSKLTMSLVNDLLKFTSSNSQIC